MPAGVAHGRTGRRGDRQSGRRNRYSRRVTTLQRRLGLGNAIVIGLASMIGAGVFYVWAPAADAAGSGLLIGLLIAAIVASLNALSSAQLAMAYPVSGGAYAFGRATVGPWTGFAAGWLFLAGKTASVGAIALIAGSYLWPAQARVVAVVVVAVLAAVNMTGIRSTAAASATIVFFVLGGILVIVGAALVAPPASTQGSLVGTPIGTDPWGILRSAGLLFFCFAGYARMATLGEEVRNPRHTLPRAIIIALAITLAIYATVGLLCVTLLGPTALARSAAPVAALVGGQEPWDTIIRIVAAIACLGSLVGILAGLSRTSLAMARGGDLPADLGRVSPKTNAPIVAEATIAVVAILGILLLDPTALIGFSSCAVLCYYAIANLSALRQPKAERWLPRLVQQAGLVGCLLLAVTLPWQSIVGTAVVLAVGLAIRRLTHPPGAVSNS
ncbi:MAG: basic amino acid/polyamine antiporter, family [Microbacteriaceae bacterium]|nr:transporter [Microbacteriaceae bacterium]MDQ1527725.1 basic amino acid/polyamine antiporter, family [Microbacteriaceae bacterium]